MTVDFLKIVTSKNRPPVAEKWQEVYNIMAVHTQGTCPVNIFTQRRPMESDNQKILDYRIANHRAITKDEFDKAISDYTASAIGLDIVVNYGDSKVKEYEPTLKLKDGLKTISLKNWVIKKNGSYRQTDPNAVVAILPKHISQDFVPNYETELPNFDNIKNQNIDVQLHLVTSTNIIAVDSDYLLFKAGTYKYDKGEKDTDTYYFALTKEQTYVIFPQRSGEEVVYVQKPYYKNNLKTLPVVPIGGKLVIEQYEDGSVREYYVSDYHGAAAWGDLTIGQGSDLRVCEVRYVYPRHWRIKVKCDNSAQGCHSENGKYITDNGNTCARCNGTGYIMDTSPMGTMMIDKGGVLLGNDGKLQEPEGFITPPTEILKHSAERESFYFTQMQASLCIMNQNMTNQSAESKKYDVSHKVDMVTRIITDLFLTYENILNIIDQYRGGTGNITITFPEDFDVRNADDILYQLVEAKKNGAPYVVIVELTKKYLLKTFGDNPANDFIISFLAKADKLFAYGLDDLQTVKSIFGSDITQKEILFHTQGYQILKAMIDKDSKVSEKQYDELKTEIEKELDKYITQPTNAAIV